MGKDIFHWIRLLKDLSHVALKSSIEGINNFSWQLVPVCHNTFIMKNLFLGTYLNLTSPHLNPCPFLCHYRRWWKDFIYLSSKCSSYVKSLHWGLPRALSSPGLATTALPAFLPGRCVLAPWSFSWPSCGPPPSLSCTGGPRGKCSTPGEVSLEWGEWRESPPSTC